MATSWFKYIGGDPCDPLSYIIVFVQPNCPDPNINLCAIFAGVIIIGGVRRPLITPELCNEILWALATMTESANVLLCP